MTTMVRDPWEDARLVATQDVLDPDVAALRRLLWVRRLVGIGLGAAGLVAAFLLLGRVVDTDGRETWGVTVLWPGLVLTGVGFVLILVGAARSSGTSRPFVESDAFLSRTDRAWLRIQIAENRPVGSERQAVVTDVARRMVAAGRALPKYLGLTALYVGLILPAPLPSLLFALSAMIVWMWVRGAREAIWSRRARRWLAQHHLS